MYCRQDIMKNNNEKTAENFFFFFYKVYRKSILYWYASLNRLISLKFRVTVL